ncbi:RNA polymerase sigma-I factor [Paenactinomyces guangxiensis]|uniref:RNA polymerase sigma factor SigI n=1 Tax=Paenactinomyces guangxiensis TaxID=1490290 RepID=A0A7W2A984_9BACL|nr:RNA polymerase sigma-I factor [Paenactinomyces guangxiensis]MBA4494912.1 RNA polymerase sigma-I factor [Paenactinomyces guangxiensis]MBH8591995.1 RNA polymerase sigma-I factor [Paenactinomyces guangxiensis]
MFGVTDLEMRVLQVQGTDSPEQRDELLRELEPHVRRIASRVCKRVITQQDDEYSIAYKALNEAIEDFSPHHKASFLSFAYRVVQRRLVDYFRQEQKHQRVVPIVGPGSRGEEASHREIIELSFEKHKKEEETRMRRSEIESFTLALEKHGITLNDLVKKSPKHRDTRENLFKIAKILVSDENLLNQFYRQKKPDKHIAKKLGMHRRTLSRHRTYLIALTVLAVEDLTLMRGYVGL